MILSIIIATYNASNCLRTCLDSIVPQLNEETELVVIDGGSRDGTIEIVRSYGESISHFISEQDKGIYDAWNKGIKISSGDWIMFVGSDDRLQPTTIARYLSVVSSISDNESYDYICAKNLYIDENGRAVSVLGNKPEWRFFRKRMSAAHVGSLHNRNNLFGSVGLYDLSYRICADYELLIRKKKNLKWLFVNEIVAEMRTGGMSFSLEAVKETYRIRKSHKSVSCFTNIILYCFDVLTYKSYFIRKNIFDKSKAIL